MSTYYTPSKFHVLRTKFLRSPSRSREEEQLKHPSGRENALRAMREDGERVQVGAVGAAALGRE